MALFTGTTANDTLTGTADADSFDLSQGGNDTASGLGGNDIFLLGAAFTAADHLDGGDGTDVLSLTGNYSSQVVFAPQTMQNIEQIGVAAGFNYNLKTDDQNVAAQQRFSVSASGLGAANSLTFDGSAETNGFFTITGGAGNDVLTGGNTAGGSCDFFFLQHGGNDTANGLGGSDAFIMGAALNAADKINGGSGTDIAILDGDYSAGVTFNSTTMRNVEYLWLNGGHSYKLTTADATVASGQTLYVNFPIFAPGNGITGPLGPGDHLYFDGSAETNGSFIVAGSPGSDTLIGGSGADEFYSGAFGGVNGGGTGGGNDFMQGGAGDDDFYFLNGDYNANDFVDGGSGHDWLTISGDFSAGLVLSSRQIKSVDQITVMDSGTTARITVEDDAVSKSGKLGDLVLIGPEHSSLVFHGEAETSASLWIEGGSGNDSIRTGAGRDWLEGHGGADRLRGGGGSDYYAYDGPSDSTSTRYDTINGFNTHLDSFVFFDVAVKKIDAEITHGALSTATFDHDLAAAVNATHLRAHDAVLFTPTSGSLAGETFLIVDQNGAAGYQASQDYVIRLINSSHLGDLSAFSDFTT